MQWSDFLAKFDVKYTLETLSRVDLELIDESGYSLLSYSLLNKDKGFIEYLLKDLKLDPKSSARCISYLTIINGVEIKDKSPMWKAAVSAGYDSKEKIQLLHQYGSDLDALDDDGMSALTWSMNYPKSIFPLLPYVDLNKKAYCGHARYRDSDDKEQSPLSWAIKRKESTVAILLIEAGADIHAVEDRTPRL